MTFLTGSADVRQPLDWVLIVIAALALIAVYGLGFYALGVGFVTTLAFEHATQWASFACGLIAAGCAAYLLLEYPGPRTQRVVLFLIAGSGILGYLAAGNGVPAVVTAFEGRPGAEIFVMEEQTFGSRGCSGTVIARNDRYSDLRVCINRFGSRRPSIGDRIEVKGTISDWGMTRDSYRVL